MARLAAKVKLLYYPTPPHLLVDVAKQMMLSRYRDKPVIVVDPCCGEGDAVTALATAMKDNYLKKNRGSFVTVETIGIEIDAARAASAAARLSRVINAPAENVAFANGYDVLFCNPPYDDNGCGGRQELDWLRRACEGGFGRWEFAIFVLPEPTWTKYQNGLDAMFRHNNVSVRAVYRFPDPEYNAFKQCVVLLDGNTRSYGWEKPQLWQQLPYRDHYISVPNRSLVLTEQPPEIGTFTNVDAAAAYASVYGDPALVNSTMQPLHPLTPTYAVLMAAAGNITGIVLDDGSVLGGTTRKIETRTEKDGNIILTERMVTVLRVRKDGKTYRLTSDDKDFVPFLAAHINEILAHMQERFPSVWREEMLPQYATIVKRVHGPRPLAGHVNGLLPAQVRFAAIGRFALERQKAIVLRGHMGVGKTVMSIAMTAGHGNHVIVFLPAQRDLSAKWAEEWQTAARDFKPLRVFMLTAEEGKDVRGGDKFAARVQIIREWSKPTQGMNVLLLSETMAKASSGWEPAVVMRHGRPTCPDCGGNAYVTWVAGQSENPEERPMYNETQCYCDNVPPGRTRPCRAALWQVAGKQGEYRAIPLARYIARYVKTPYYLIVDEAHNTKSADTARGNAASTLAAAAWRVIWMSGTIYNGYAASLFHLLRRVNPSFARAWEHRDEGRFSKAYGLSETTKRPKLRSTSVGGIDQYTTTTKQLPGMHPQMAALLLPHMIVVQAADLDYDLPPLRHWRIFPDWPKEGEWLTNLLKLAHDYGAREAMQDPPNKGPLSKWAFARTGALDYAAVDIDGYQVAYAPPATTPLGPPWTKAHVSWHGNGAFHPDLQPDRVTRNGRDTYALVERPAPTVLSAKETALVRIVAKMHAEGRHTLVMIDQTHVRPVQHRLVEILEAYGFKATWMPETVKNRVQFCHDALVRKCDVIVTSYPLIKEGIDLVAFTAMVMYTPVYDAVTVQQVMYRIHRIGQVNACDIFWLGWNNTAQATIWALQAKKHAAINNIQGDIVNGLAMLFGEEDHLLTEMQYAANITTRMPQDNYELPPLPAPVTLTPVKPVTLPPVALTSVPVVPMQQQSLFDILFTL